MLKQFSTGINTHHNLITVTKRKKATDNRHFLFIGSSSAVTLQHSDDFFDRRALGRIVQDCTFGNSEGHRSCCGQQVENA